MIKKMLKKIPFLRTINNNFKIKNDYISDYKKFKKHWINSKETNDKIGYDIMLEVHSLEKGMTSSEPRRFGKNKVYKIISLLNKCDSNDKMSYATNLGLNALQSYLEFYRNHNWTKSEEYNVVSEYLNNKKIYRNIKVGSYILQKKDFIDKSSIDYDSFLQSRHAIREFLHKEISEKDFCSAVNMTLKTPTACNRQMCKIYYIRDSAMRSRCLKYGHGLTNFDIDSVNLFIITFDYSSFCYSGDRNQGWFNSGLVGMNFVNSLHSLGIGSCFIQFGNPSDEEQELKKVLSIPDNEGVAVMIAAGYYKNKMTVTYSSRKNIDEISKII